MSKLATALSFIRDNPGTDTNRIAAEVGMSTPDAAACTTALFKQGRVTRDAFRTPAGRRAYRYTAVEGTPRPPEPPQEPVVPAPAPAPKPVAPLIPSIDALVEDFARAVVQRITVRVRELLSREVKAFTAEADSMHYTLDAPAKERLRVVLIVGLLPQQAGIITAEFGNCFDLRFWKNESTQKLQGMARGAARVLVMVSKVSHSSCDAISAAGVPFVRIGGGLSMLRQHLEAYYLEDE